MRKIEDLNSVCKNWKPGRDVKGNPLKVKACWACYFNLWSYCWIDEYNSSDKLVVYALEGDERAKRILYRRLKEASG